MTYLPAAAKEKEAHVTVIFDQNCMKRNAEA